MSKTILVYEGKLRVDGGYEGSLTVEHNQLPLGEGWECTDVLDELEEYDGREVKITVEIKE